MKDEQCTSFLQWALPKLSMRWRGFRKVRKQVCKRIHRRMDALNISSIEKYQTYLENHPGEWEVLDRYCRITISNFYRNRKIFETVAIELLPAIFNETDHARVWSAGCASGEEPYSVSLIFHKLIQMVSSHKRIEIIATDADAHMLKRAREGCYKYSSIKEIPENWKKDGFDKQENYYCLREIYKEPVTFQQQDIRKKTPKGKFDLIFCRNLVATYFNDELQKSVFKTITGKLKPNGYLILGKNELIKNLPEKLETWERHSRIFVKK